MYFGLLLSLVFGFLNVYYFRYSYVSDHFQYLAMLGPIALGSAGIISIFSPFAGKWKQSVWGVGAVVFLTLGILTWKQCGVYASSETLWRATLVNNPDCWLAHNNLGHMLLDQGKVDEALVHLQTAVKIHPDDATAQNNLGSALLRIGNRDEALARFQKAIAIDPDYAVAYNNLGDFFLKQHQPDEAIGWLQKALALKPNLSEAGYNLGNAYLQKGQLALAIQQWQTVLSIQPDYAKALNNLGNAFLNTGQIQQAINNFRAAVAAAPEFSEAWNNLGSALIQNGQLDQAVECLRKALTNQPDFVPAQNNLAWVLATCSQSNFRDGQEAFRLAQRANLLSGGNDPLILRTLAAAYAESGQFASAINTDRSALQLLQSSSALAENILEQIQHYQAGLPTRE
jgi:superkiller protein 3